MANIGGPKSPPDLPKGVGGKLLHLPTVAKTAITLEISQDLVEHSEGFDPNAAKGTVVPETTLETGRGGHVQARLAALGLIKTAAQGVGRVKDTPQGKIFEGSLTIESMAGISKLEGVVRVSGDLTLQETVA